MTLRDDAARGTVMAMRREITDLRNRADELFHALACALAVPVSPDTGEAVHAKEQHILDWARSFMSQKQAMEVAHVASSKYVQKADTQCHHDWAYDNHRAGMLCGTCGAFVSDQL